MAVAVSGGASRVAASEFPGEATSRAWVLGLTSVASFMVALDTLVVATALSTIRNDLGASIEALEWTVNA